MTAADWHQWLLLGFAIASVIVFITLRWGTTAAYGRHDAKQRAWWWGPSVPTRPAWILMEMPASIAFAVFFLMGDRALEWAPLLLFALWQAHYIQRSFLYPLRRRLKPGDSTPLLVPILAFSSNVGIAFLNASVLSWSSIGGYDSDWLQDPRLILGVLIFVVGYRINRKADALLAALRAPGGGGYRIPRGWLFERVSCPNYLGEFLIWIGWAVATWSLAGAVFALWTVANLLPRSLSHHAWYRDHFPDYPPTRKAVIPGLL